MTGLHTHFKSVRFSTDPPYFSTIKKFTFEKTVYITYSSFISLSMKAIHRRKRWQFKILEVKYYQGKSSIHGQVNYAANSIRKNKTKQNLRIIPIICVKKKKKKNTNLETFRKAYMMIKTQTEIFFLIIFKAHIKTNDFKSTLKEKKAKISQFLMIIYINRMLGLQSNVIYIDRMLGHLYISEEYHDSLM